MSGDVCVNLHVRCVFVVFAKYTVTNRVFQQVTIHDYCKVFPCVFQFSRPPVVVIVNMHCISSQKVQKHVQKVRSIGEKRRLPQSNLSLRYRDGMNLSDIFMIWCCF